MRGARTTIAAVPEVRRVRDEDLEEVVASLVRAFDDDPVSVYLFPDPESRPKGLQRFFRLQLRTTFLPRGEVYTTDDRRAAALWMPPTATRPGARELFSQLPMIWILGGRFGPALRLIQTVEARHPKTPHYYLGTLGTDPPLQGHGLGSAVIAPVLARCDAQAIPAYLESSKESNLGFYFRHGFEVTGEIEPLDKKVKLWLMWREPRMEN